jgi:tRNA pseudouridine55 synthase
LSCEGRTATIKVSCSKGTYIRTLAQDIGRALGVGAHLVALRRDRVGTFDVKDAFTLEQIAESASPLKAIRPLSELPAELAQIFIKGPAIEPSQL